MALFQNGLLPASFRGVPFAVRSSASQVGRRIALHQYPGRDDPWAEDMGRAARRWRFNGFLVTNDRVYAGGPVALQRLLLIAALEKKGPGTLTHPTLGLLTVVVESASVSDPLEAGTYSEIEIVFLEAGKQKYPSILVSTGAKLLSAAVLAKAAIAADFVRAFVLISQTSATQDRLASTGRAWGDKIQALGSDATAVMGLSSRLVGSYGRFSEGANSGYAAGFASPYAKDVTIADLVVEASNQRAAIADAAAAFDRTIAQLTVTTTLDDVASAAQALVASLVAACANPADAIRLLGEQLAFVFAGGEQTAVDRATGDLFRRTAVAAMAQVAVGFQPASHDQALAIRNQIVRLIDDQVDHAGDTGEDETFNALRTLRTEVVRDLNARGADLSPTRDFTFATPLPAVVLATRLYRDPARGDELVTQAVPVHPLFMPTAFRALAS
jgi:prophage DNA circulation protein